ncbi:MAG: hypothetical protein ACKN89_13890 [Cyanobium sp.]
MHRLLTRQRRHRPDLLQPITLRVGRRPNRRHQLLFPACSGQPSQPAEARAKSYWGRQAISEAVMAALVSSLLTATVQASPQLFSQSPAQSLQDISAWLLSGQADPAQPRLLDCP